MIHMAKPQMGAEEKQAVMEVLDSGIIAQGPRVKAFEEGFAAMCGVKHAIAASSGTTVLHLTMLAHEGGVVFVLEVNPRASRTVPFVSKATGLPLAKIAARCMVGKSLASQGFAREVIPHYFSVKEAVFPFAEFRGVDTILGPEMKSTGEVMGIGLSFSEAFVKSQMAASVRLPTSGQVFISVKESDKSKAVSIARDLRAAGFTLLATRGTAAAIAAAGVAVTAVNKVTEGRPHVVDMIKNHEIVLIVNTVDEKRKAISDSRSIRTSGLASRVTIYTTIWGAEAATAGIRNRGELVVYPLQDLHAQLH